MERRRFKGIVNVDELTRAAGDGSGVKENEIKIRGSRNVIIT